MLIITGLLTLLAIAHAGGDHIKGGFHAKEGSLAQEQVAQEDVASPYTFNVKTGSVFGTKVTREEAGDAEGRIRGSYTVSDPRAVLYEADEAGFHASLKTSEPNIKTHSPANAYIEAIPRKAPALALHHTVKAPAASLAAVQDQVPIGDLAEATRGIKSLKPLPSRKTSFSQTDIQVRDPVARPVLETVKTAENPVLETKDIKTMKTVAINTRPSQQGIPKRDPIARPFIQTVKSTDPAGSKVLNTAGRRKTSSSLRDTQVVPRPEAQSVKASRKTVKVAEPSNIQSKTAVKTTQQNVRSSSASDTSESIAEIARRNTLRRVIPVEGIQSVTAEFKDNQNPQILSISGSQSQAEFGVGNQQGGIVLDEKQVNFLLNAGYQMKENGEIVLDANALQLLQKYDSSSQSSSSQVSRGSSFDAARTSQSSANIRNLQSSNTLSTAQQRRAMTQGTRRVQTSVNNLDIISRNQGLVNTGRVSSSLTGNRKPIPTRTSTSSSLASSQTGISRSGISRNAGQSISAQNEGSIIFNGREISINGLKAGQLFDENLQPILSDKTPGLTQTLKPADSPRITQGAAVTTLTSNYGSRTLLTGTARRQQQPTPIIPKDKMKLRTPEVSRPITSGQINTQSAIYRSPVRSQAVADIGRLRTSTNAETVLFNGKEISIDGLKAGQMFDENLQPILTVNPQGLKPVEPKTPNTPQIVKPGNLPPVTRNAGVSTLTSNYGSGTLTVDSAARRRQQTANIAKDKVILRTPARSPTLPKQFNTQANIPKLPLNQGDVRTGAGQLTTTANAETILFNGKVITVTGLKEGQLFDENLQPISPGKTDGLIPAVPKTLTTSQTIKPARNTQSSAVSLSNYGSSRISNERTIQSAQQSGNIVKDKMKMRSPSRSSIATGQLNAQTNILRKPLITQGAPIRSTGQIATITTAEKVLFNGKEISIDGLKAGQLFDENLQPISSAKPLNLQTPAISQFNKPASSPRVTYGSSVISQSSGRQSTGSTTRRRQQIVNIPDDKTKLRTPIRIPPTTTGQITTQTSSLRGPLRSQVLTRTQTGQSTTSAKAETVLFNGKEISVASIKEGQLFDENLQPILSVKPDGFLPPDFKAPVIPKIIKPASSPRITQSAGVSTLTSNYGSSSLTTGSGIQRRPTTENISKDKMKFRTPVIPPQTTAGSPLISQDVSGQLTTTKDTETILFNGKEIRIDGLRAGQLFNENLEPISSSKPIIPKPEGIRISNFAQDVTLEKSPVIPQDITVSTLSSSYGSRTLSTGGAIRRQEAANKLKDNVLLKTQERSQILSTGQVNTQRRRPGRPIYSQDVSGIRRTTSSGGAETILFNGKEIRIDGLRAGQFFDENLQPITTVNAGNSRIANTRTSAISQTANVASSGVLPPVSQGSVGSVSSGRQSQTSLPGTMTTGISAFQRSVSTGLISSGSPIPQSRRRTEAAKATAINRQSSSGSLSSQGRTTSRRGDLTSSAVISGVSGTTRSRIPALDARTTSMLSQKPPANIRINSNVATQTSGRISQSQRTVLSSGGAVGNAGLTVGQTTPNNASPVYQGQPSPLAEIKPVTASNVDTVLFNGKEISIAGLKEGQLFDENLQPIMAINSEMAKTDDFKAFNIPRNQNLNSRSGISQTTRTTSSIYGSNILSNRNLATRRQEGLSLTNIPKEKVVTTIPSDLPAPNRQSNVQSNVRSTLRSTVSRQPVPMDNEGIAMFDGKEIKISDLRAGQLFDENLQPIRSGGISIGGSAEQGSGRTSILRDNSQTLGLRSSITATGGIVSRTNSAISSQTIRDRTSNSRTSSDSLVSGGSLQNSPSSARRQENTYRGSIFRTTDSARSGVLQLNAGDVATQYSATGSRVPGYSQEVSQERLSQDSIETPISSQTFQDPNESKQMLINPKDILEQSSLSSSDTFKTAQLQETIPFSASSPRTTSKLTVTKVSQKDIDFPSVQQEMMAADFTGYLPKASFLPPFNYGLPQMSASKYRVKTPVVQEQQKLEQILL